MNLDFLIVFLASYLAWILGAGLVLFIFIGERRKQIFIACESILAAMISRFGFTEIIRYFYDKPRPFEILDGARKIIEQDPGGSFPSGHAAFFFAIATTLFIYDRRWGSAFFLASVAMGIGRVAANVHWPIDIVGGAIIGIISSLLIHIFFRKYI